MYSRTYSVQILIASYLPVKLSCRLPVPCMLHRVRIMPREEDYFKPTNQLCLLFLHHYTRFPLS